MFSKMRLFQKAATGIFVVFMGILIFVTVYAHMRPSGSTRQNMAQAQLLRKHVETHKNKDQKSIHLTER